VKQIIKRDDTDSETIFDRWGNALTDIPTAPVNTNPQVGARLDPRPASSAGVMERIYSAPC
jgi:hypothetical protein